MKGVYGVWGFSYPSSVLYKKNKGRIEGIFTDVASIYANLLEQTKAFT